jgi:hypothetical protein
LYRCSTPEKKSITQSNATPSVWSFIRRFIPRRIALLHVCSLYQESFSVDRRSITAFANDRSLRIKIAGGRLPYCIAPLASGHRKARENRSAGRRPARKSQSVQRSAGRRPARKSQSVQRSAGRRPARKSQSVQRSAGRRPAASCTPFVKVPGEDWPASRSPFIEVPGRDRRASVVQVPSFAPSNALSNALLKDVFESSSERSLERSFESVPFRRKFLFHYGQLFEAPLWPANRIIVRGPGAARVCESSRVSKKKTVSIVCLAPLRPVCESNRRESQGRRPSRPCIWPCCGPNESFVETPVEDWPPIIVRRNAVC